MEEHSSIGTKMFLPVYFNTSNVLKFYGYQVEKKNEIVLEHFLVSYPLEFGY
jgi:hypothetical protein